MSIDYIMLRDSSWQLDNRKFLFRRRHSRLSTWGEHGYIATSFVCFRHCQLERARWREQRFNHVSRAQAVCMSFLQEGLHSEEPAEEALATRLQNESAQHSVCLHLLPLQEHVQGQHGETREKRSQHRWP